MRFRYTSASGGYFEGGRQIGTHYGEAVMKTPGVALVTGAARRVGAAIAKELHAAGYRVIVHCHRSVQEGEALCAELNARASGTAFLLEADLSVPPPALPSLVQKAVDCWGRLDLLVNNASLFYPATLPESTPQLWNELMGVNAMVPFFLSQAAAPWLSEQGGAIVNIGDIHGVRPLRRYAVYCQTKAALLMQTRVLAKELAPAVRVNAVSPGAVAWPEGINALEVEAQKKILAEIPLQRHGTPEDIARAVRFLAKEAGYMTGQVLVVDGGRSLQG